MDVLILDDEVLSVEIMLKKIDWKACGIDKVHTAYNVEEAKEVVQREAIDIILCDIEMPGENGLEFMFWARENQYKMECIFLTCHAKFEYAQEAVRLSSKDYILLPAPFDVIEEKVRKVAMEVRENRENERVYSAGRQWIKEKGEFARHNFGEMKSKSKLADEIEMYVAEHIGDFDLSVQNIAEYMSMNRDYLGSVFKQEKGITLNKYIVKTRMNLAASLIREGDMSIAVIAEMVGYENYSYFSSSFKKVYGCNPKDMK